MKKFYILGTVIIVTVFFGSYLYYKELEKNIPQKVAKSKETIINVDKIRFTFKIGSLTRKALNSYLLALRTKEKIKIDEALDYYEGAIGFAYIKYTKDQKLLDYILPRLESSMELIQKNKLNISDKELNRVLNYYDEINRFVENREKEVWRNMQTDYIEFRTHQVEKENLYKLFLLIVFLSIFIITGLYLSRNYLKGRLSKKIHKQTKEIKDLQERLLLAADKALAGYWEWHLNTNYLYISKGWRDFLGYGEDELESSISTFEKLLHPDDKKTTINLANKYIKKEIDTYNTKFRLKHKNGEYKWVSAIGAIIESDENIFFGFHIDIDDLTTTKEMLVAQSKAATMGEMISMIAHQWKQPLSTLSMVGNNLEADIAFDMLEKKNLEEYARDIEEQVLYLGDTIDTFKNFLRPDKEKNNCNVQDIIETSLSIISKSLENNNIELIKEFSKVPDITANESELMQVFINLINNSKDAFKINKTQDKKLWLRSLKKEDYIVIEIEDTAGGIDKDKIEKIFDAYFTTKGEFKGTGLGLYIVKTIIEEHYNGKIRVENTQKGVKFSLYIPV